ncbi:MAG TPA: helix-hairpin-helix domain-containing protein [Deltaproteobacteria bacterium]|nr:helix-hairpin-helix domain-containing protein [Deltaproteobacteria bacterium]HQI82165.1 helix-hairpin-helix domain-containing protein [Deltaproteobacteria bacterium]
MNKVGTMVWCVLILVCSFSLSLYAAQGVINVNTATTEQLMMLPGIGEKTAKAVVSYRQANGQFKSIDDVAKVKGIGKKKLDKIRQNLSLQGANTYLPDVHRSQAQGKASKPKS